VLLSTGARAYMADMANAVPLFGRSVNILKLILKQSRLVLSARSDHDAAEW